MTGTGSLINQDVIQKQSDRTSSVCGQSMSGTSYHRTSWKHRQPTRSRTGWIDTGKIWAFKADSYIAHHPQVTSKTHTDTSSKVSCTTREMNTYRVVRVFVFRA